MRLIGLLFVLAGMVLAVASKVTAISSKLSFIPKDYMGYIIYVGIGLVVLGVILLKFGDSGVSQSAEVPIYQGKKIVGYRRA